MAGDQLGFPALKLKVWDRTFLSMKRGLKSHHLLPRIVVSKELQQEAEQLCP
jgi:hypothetical protein